MSQKSVLIALTIAIVLTMTVEAEAKRIGCASFGHSCYGGHGKRSDPAIQGQENDAASAEPLTMIRVLQRRFQPEAVAMTNEIQEREREIKLMVLNVLSEVINDVLKKSTQPEDSLA